MSISLYLYNHVVSNFEPNIFNISFEMNPVCFAARQFSKNKQAFKFKESYDCFSFLENEKKHFTAGLIFLSEH